MKDSTFKAAGQSALLAAVVSALGSTVYAQGVPDGLVNYWRFDETDGAIAADEINSRNATWQNLDPTTMAPVNLTWLPTGGMRGGAAQLTDAGGNAVDNFFSIIGTSELNSLPEIVGANSLTFTAWINPDAQVGANQGGIIMTRGNTQPNTVFGIAVEGSNPYHIDARAPSDVPNGPDIIMPEGPGGEMPGPWYHIAFVWENNSAIEEAEPSARVYIDGILSNNATSGMFPDPFFAGSAGNSGAWQIGNDACCGGRDYSGLIDDVTVWTTALTEQNIILLANGEDPLTLDTSNTDGDIYPDSYELLFPDCFTVGVNDDSTPNSDCDDDGLFDSEEFSRGTNPNEEDTEGDGLIDGDEVLTFGTDPLDPDSDNDGITDGDEVDGATDVMVTFAGQTGMFDIPFDLDPTTADSDGDLFFDAAELFNGTDPLNDLDPPSVDPPALTGLGLLAHWTFDETTGTTAENSIAGPSAALYNALWQGGGDADLNVAGQIGAGARLNGGAGNFFLVANDPLQELVTEGSSVTGVVRYNSFTLSGWLQLADTMLANNGIFVTRAGAGTDLVLPVETQREAFWGFDIFEGTDEGGADVIIGDYRYGNNPNLRTTSAMPPVFFAAGEWIHFAMTMLNSEEGTDRQIYVNGSPILEFADLTEILEFRSARNWFFGTDPVADDRVFNGLIDDFAIFGQALTDEQILALYNDGLGDPGNDFTTNAAGVQTPRFVVAPPAPSAFRITAIVSDGNGGFDVTFDSSEQADTDTFALQVSSDLTGFTNVADRDMIARTADSTTTNIPASVVASATDGRLFFRVVVNAPAAAN